MATVWYVVRRGTLEETRAVEGTDADIREALDRATREYGRVRIVYVQGTTAFTVDSSEEEK